MNKRIREYYGSAKRDITYSVWYTQRIRRLESALTYAMNPNTWGLPAEKWLQNIEARAIEEDGR